MTVLICKEGPVFARYVMYGAIQHKLVGCIGQCAITYVQRQSTLSRMPVCKGCDALHKSNILDLHNQLYTSHFSTAASLHFGKLVYVLRWHMLRGCGHLLRGTDLLPHRPRHSCMMQCSQRLMFASVCAPAAPHECSRIESTCDSAVAGTGSQSSQGTGSPTAKQRLYGNANFVSIVKAYDVLLMRRKWTVIQPRRTKLMVDEVTFITNEVCQWPICMFHRESCWHASNICTNKDTLSNLIKLGL